ncbi:MAG: L-gulono-1,4-lactone dehydrogenase [Candidatus Erwinia impunctatus]|nr:L-gulono-1,4-lactone dehydrogenase [Culicoides impunctatus]
MVTPYCGYPRRETTLNDDDHRLWNWANNAVLGEKKQIHQPENEQVLRQLISDAPGRIRMIGSKMSPGRMLDLSADTDIFIDLSKLSGMISSTADSATFWGGTLLQDIYTTLTDMGRMLPSSPGVIAAQTLGGALATGTHGQGLQQSSIADEALMIRMVLADGSVREFVRGDDWFPAVQSGLGALGVVTQVTLRTQPSRVYTCFKHAFNADDLEHDIAAWNHQYVLSKAWWFPEENQVHVWNSREASAEEMASYLANNNQLLSREVTSDAMNQTIDQTLEHMRSDTQIVDDNGKPFRTVTRFKDFSDVTGDIYQVFCRGIATPQINVEIGIPLSRVPDVVQKIKRWHTETQPHMHYPVIMRCTGASEAWLSPSFGEETCYFGFVVYYAEDGSLSAEGLAFLTAVEALLAEEGGKPHWGKYFDASLYDWSRCYPHWGDFLSVKTQLDPGNKFANTFIDSLFDQTGAKR